MTRARISFFFFRVFFIPWARTWWVVCISAFVYPISLSRYSFFFARARMQIFFRIIFAPALSLWYGFLFLISRTLNVHQKLTSRGTVYYLNCFCSSLSHRDNLISSLTSHTHGCNKLLPRSSMNVRTHVGWETITIPTFFLAVLRILISSLAMGSREMCELILSASNVFQSESVRYLGCRGCALIYFASEADLERTLVVSISRGRRGWGEVENASARMICLPAASRHPEWPTIRSDVTLIISR